MGVRHLDTFVRKNVPDGFISVNIENEIRRYFETAATANPPAPVVVFDLISMYVPLSNYDKPGLFFGGRFNLAHSVVKTFFTKLTQLGAQLVFFLDGPTQESKTGTWCARQDIRYNKTLITFDAIEQGANLEILLKKCSAPLNFYYPLKAIAKNFGQYKVALARECDQDLAEFATQNNALAVVADDSDFLIYEGSWRYWSSRDLDLETLTTMEYNRSALLTYLDLSFSQMALFATLSGNDIMPYEIVRKLHSKLGSFPDKFTNISKYVRQRSRSPLMKVRIVCILRQITGHNKIQPSLIDRFQESLDTYRMNTTPQIAQNDNLNNDPIRAALIQEDSPFMYLIWEGKRLDISLGIVDMRQADFGSQYAILQISLILRMAGIILFYRKPLRPTHCGITIKLRHQIAHRPSSFPVQYPQHFEPLTLLELLDKDPVIQESHRTAKEIVLAWIASDTLQSDWLRSVPRILQLTVYTLYYLVEQQTLELFEADLLLQVAYDVAYETYDIRGVDYPNALKLRPFQLVFLYQKVYSYMAKAFRLVGMNDDNFRDDPPFDGVLFHLRYDDWRDGRCDLDKIRAWRIYERVRKEERY